MNEQLMLQQLISILNTSNIMIHKDLLKDIRLLIGKSGEEKAFFNRLSFHLKLLVSGDSANHGDFERLRDEDQLYSMHVNTKNINCRILYTYIHNDCFLLCAFYERAGTSAGGYPDAILMALKRKKDLEGSI